MPNTLDAATPPLSPRRLITIAATAEWLGVSARSVWRLIAAGQLQTVRIGKAVRVKIESIETFVAAGGVK